MPANRASLPLEKELEELRSSIWAFRFLRDDLLRKRGSISGSVVRHLELQQLADASRRLSRAAQVLITAERVFRSELLGKEPE